MSRTARGRFEKGCSGNPSGRPKLSELEKRTLDDICNLAPKAVRELEKLLNSKTRADVKLKAIEIILERVCGKSTTLKQLEAEPVQIIIDV